MPKIQASHTDALKTHACHLPSHEPSACQKVANKCICCSNKLGVLNGNHLDGKLCDSCYFVFAGLVNSIDETSDVNLLNDYYDQAIEKVEKRKHLIDNYSELCKEIMITTGFNFEGYTIESYCGVFSGNISLGTGFFTELSINYNHFHGSESFFMEDKLDNAKDAALNLLIKKALLVGANAIIGISFNLSNLINNMVIFSVTGTAVKIIKN